MVLKSSMKGIIVLFCVLICSVITNGGKVSGPKSIQNKKYKQYLNLDHNNFMEIDQALLQSERVQKQSLNVAKNASIRRLGHSNDKKISDLKARIKRAASKAQLKMNIDTTTSGDGGPNIKSSNILDQLIHNGALPAHITSQLESILKNLTVINKSSEIVTLTTPIALEDNKVNNTVNVSDSENLEFLLERFKELYPVHLWKTHGWFDDEYMSYINIHWLKFPPPSKTAHYTLACIYAMMAVCGFFGNAFVIFMFFKCQSLRTPANILVVNLAFSDFLIMTEAPLFIFNSAYLGPATGQLGCKIYGFIGGISGTVSIGTLAAIAFDRYSVVLYPLEPLRNITRLRAKLSVVVVWIYGAFFALIPALDIGLGKYVPEGFLTSCSFDYLSDDRKHKIFIFAFFCAAWLLPLVIISFCYFNILKVVILTRSISKQPGGMSSRHCKEQEKRKTELKLAGVVIGVIGLFFAAWTPYSIISLLGITGNKDFIRPFTSEIPAIFCKVASVIDPFVYIVTHPKFRQECENLLLSKKERRRRSTMRQGWSVSNQQKKLDREITSEDDVEVVEMGKLPFSSEMGQENEEPAPKRVLGRATVTPAEEPIETVSLKTHNKSLAVNPLPKTAEENKQLQPPSWFVKPQFVQRGSSIKNVVKTIQRMTSEDSLHA